MTVEPKLKQDNAVRYFSTLIDFLKHLSTLSLGLLVVIAGFFEQNYANADWKFLIRIVIGGFGLTVFCSSVAFLSIVNGYGYTVEPPLDITLERTTRLLHNMCVAAVISFLIGVIALVLFALHNL